MKLLAGHKISSANTEPCIALNLGESTKLKLDAWHEVNASRQQKLYFTESPAALKALKLGSELHLKLPKTLSKEPYEGWKLRVVLSQEVPPPTEPLLI